MSRILILDFGSQVTQLIARRVREMGVYCELHPNDVSAEFVRSFNPSGIILSGSHASTYEAQDLRAPQVVFELGVPVLGICYGMFTMAVQLGGQVEASDKREFGFAELRARGHTQLFNGIQDTTNAEGHGLLHVWMSHGDKVTAMPPGFKLMASTANCPVAGMADEARKFYAVQFHPEVTHTTQGTAILRRFVLDICGATPDWTMPSFVDTAINRIRDQVGSDEVILGLSGGVDSSVAAALIHKAIGDQLTCVFVDHGLLRLNEAEQVMQIFAQNLGVKVIHVDATAQFMGKLAGVADPEQKRKIIGREFVEVFQLEAAKLPNAKWLAQGTIYPDVIESAGAKTKKAHSIKSHHNVGGLPESLKLGLCEPLRDLFKDEVRALGIALGLPPDMVYRHPFPGPGLGVRILGDVTQRAADLLRRADAIFIEELRNTPFMPPLPRGEGWGEGAAASKSISESRTSQPSPPGGGQGEGYASNPNPRATTSTSEPSPPGRGQGEGVNPANSLPTANSQPKNWYEATSQAFAVFLPVKSVGVMGDGRTYENVVALRAVQTTDFMTAHWAHLPHDLLGRLSNRIINEVRGINRVVYDISGKPPATIEWE